MEDIHRKVLQKNRPYLVKEVMLEPLWAHLLAQEIFTDEMVDHIQATGAKSSQMQRLLSDLCRRGPNAYSQFIECLVETEQQHIVDKLNNTEELLRSREPKYISTPISHSTMVSGHSSEVSTPSLSRGYHSAPTKELHRDLYMGNISAPHSEPTHHNPLKFSSGISHSNGQGRSTLVTTTANSRASYERSTSVSTTAPVGDTVSLDTTNPGPTGTVTLMDAMTTAAHSSSVSNSITDTRPPPPFEVTTHPYHHDGEITPNRVDNSIINERVKKNLMPMFRRSPVTQTDNGDGVSLPARSHPHLAGVQSTDHPQAVDVNPYPQVLGIPQTSGRLKFTVHASQNRVNADWQSMYKMTSDPRGYCIIINNRHFTGHLKERLGTDVDRDNLYMLYSQLGYQICIQENLTGMEMLITLRDFAQLANHRAVDSCVIILLTHGLEGQIYGSDAKLINLSEVFNFFDGTVCPGLQGKPKFFLVQACRGEKFDAGFDMTDNGQTDTAGPASQAMLEAQQQGINDLNSLSRKLPSCSDFLIAYATVPGFVSWRNSEQGSWFIQALCEVFAKHCHHEDAVNMLVQVNDKVATIYESATRHKQMPYPVVLLRKKLFFFPPVSA